MVEAMALLYPTFPATIRLQENAPDQGLEVLKRIERPDGGWPVLRILSQACVRRPLGECQDF